MTLTDEERRERRREANRRWREAHPARAAEVAREASRRRRVLRREEENRASREATGRLHVERRAWLDALKAAPCTDCGCVRPPALMDLDHLPGAVKVANVGNLLRSASWERVLAEVAKCEPVCKPCHRARTAQRLTEQKEHA